MKVIADASAIISAIDDQEPFHEECLATLDDSSVRLVTPLVVAEVSYLLLRAGDVAAACAFLRDVEVGYYTIANPTSVEYGIAADLLEKYDGTFSRKRAKRGTLDSPDAFNVVVAAREATKMTVTLDHDYRQVKPLIGFGHFTLLPYDASP